MRPKIQKPVVLLLLVFGLAIGDSPSLVAGTNRPLKSHLRQKLDSGDVSHAPRLGIVGHIEPRGGMMIVSVTPDSFASKIGLKAGDKIIRINDRQVTNDRSYDESLWTAVRFLDGYVDLVILDGKSGRTHHRTGYLNTGSDLSYPRSAPEFHTRHSAVL